MILSLINSHHDKPKLRAEFESMADQMQAALAASGATAQMKTDFQNAANRYLVQIDDPDPEET